jgi:hypothetical protein
VGQVAQVIRAFRVVALTRRERTPSEASSTGERVGSRPHAGPECSRAEALVSIPAYRRQSSVDAEPFQYQIVPSNVVTVTSALSPFREPLPPQYHSSITPDGRLLICEGMPIAMALALPFGSGCFAW